MRKMYNRGQFGAYETRSGVYKRLNFWYLLYQHSYRREEIFDHSAIIQYSKDITKYR